MDLRTLTMERLGTLIAINCQKMEVAKKMQDTKYMEQLEGVRAKLLKAVTWKIDNENHK